MRRSPLKLHTLIQHPPKREQLLRFIMLLGILAAYTGYVSWKYEAATGGLIAALTWSFFVLCTPIADGGFLIDFPVRLLFNVRMWVVEMFVWILAGGLNFFTLSYAPDVYEKTLLTSLLKKIVLTPYPYWGIIALCCAGTFMSIIFGDEMLDIFHHRDAKIWQRHGFKYRVVAMLAGFTVVVLAYIHLLESLHINTDMVF
ncbi:MAG: hypothetical protein GC134_07625 [Proteobacteria bacterium]|nr:hypothetical protein [Pseudomonadota bacterium]